MNTFSALAEAQRRRLGISMQQMRDHLSRNGIDMAYATLFMRLSGRRDYVWKPHEIAVIRELLKMDKTFGFSTSCNVVSILDRISSHPSSQVGPQS